MTRGGIGADTQAEVVDEGFPSTLKFKRFNWHGNTGGAGIPDLINATVNDVSIKVNIDYASFLGAKDAVIVLTKN